MIVKCKVKDNKIFFVIKGFRSQLFKFINFQGDRGLISFRIARYRVVAKPEMLKISTTTFLSVTIATMVTLPKTKQNSAINENSCQNVGLSANFVSKPLTPNLKGAEFFDFMILIYVFVFRIVQNYFAVLKPQRTMEIALLF